MYASKLDDARGWFNKALAVGNTLTAADPSNTDWQGDLAVLYIKLGDVARVAGKLANAHRWLDKALTIANPRRH